MTRPFPRWDPDRDDTFVCQAVHRVTPTTTTVILAPRRPATVAFDAGQYVTAEFEISGAAVNRCYTIASPPTHPERIALTVKRSGRGTVSGWLQEGGLRPGGLVRIGEPQGEFTTAAHPAPSVLLLTAGSGITPALSMLRTQHDLGAPQDVVLVHSDRMPAAVPYREEIDLMVRHLPALRVHYLCSGADADRPDHGVLARRLDPATLTALVPDVADREVFVCGPAGYRSVARAAALTAGAALARVHEESFELAAPRTGTDPGPTAATTGPGCGLPAVEVVGGGDVADVAGPEPARDHQASAITARRTAITWPLNRDA